MASTGRHSCAPRRCLAALLLVLAALAAPGCRSMSAAPRPVAESATFRTAVTLDPEPHVLSITVLAPSGRWDFATPRSTTLSAARSSVGEVVHASYESLTGRTLGYHMLGHVTIELKSVDPDTGAVRYTHTGSTNVDGRDIFDLVLRQKVGYAIVDRPVAGRLQSADEVARIADEPAELGVPAVRLRVLISRAAAERMRQFLDELQRQRIHERYSLTAYPLRGDGVGCTSLAVGLLDAAGLLDPEWREQWRVGFRVPEALYGDPDRGVRVPVRAALIGPASRRWAAADEPHRWVAFYDTTAMYRSIEALARTPPAALPPGVTTDDPISRAVGRRLGLPVVTADRRATPTPTGPIFAASDR